MGKSREQCAVMAIVEVEAAMLLKLGWSLSMIEEVVDELVHYGVQKGGGREADWLALLPRS